MAFEPSELDVGEKGETVLCHFSHKSTRLCICYSLSSIYCEEENSHFRVPLILPSRIPSSGSAEDWKAFLDCCFGQLVERKGLQVFPKFTGGGKRSELQDIEDMFEALTANMSELQSRLAIARVLLKKVKKTKDAPFAKRIETWISGNDDKNPEGSLNQTRIWLEDLELPVPSMRVMASILCKMPNITIVALNGANMDADATETLCTALEHAENLVALYLIHNKIGPSGAVAIANKKESWKKLETLFLNDPKSDSIRPMGAKNLFELPEIELELNRYRPSYLDSLKTVSLSGHLIEDTGVQYIVTAFPIMEKLETLYLDKNEITDEGAAVLTQNIHFAVRLTYLSTRGNHITSDMENALQNTLSECVSSRQAKLSQSCSCLSPNGKLSQCLSKDVDEDAQAVFKTLQQNSSDLQSRLVYASGMLMIAKRRNASYTLQLDTWIHEHSRSRPADVLEQDKIVLTQLSLRETLMRPLAFALHEMKNLTFVTLRNADLDGQATEMLCEGLKHIVLLHTLDLSQNCIGLRGAEAIGRMKTIWVRLSVLDLSNPMSDPFMTRGARALLEFPRDENQRRRDPQKSYLSSLSRLNLDGQKIGDEGVVWLVENFGIMKKTVTISLTQNEITEIGADVLINNLSKMRRLSSLSFHLNNMSSDAEARLQQALDNTLASREHLGEQFDDKQRLEREIQEKERLFRECQEEIQHLSDEKVAKESDCIYLENINKDLIDEINAKDQEHTQIVNETTDIQKRLEAKVTDLKNLVVEKDHVIKMHEKDVDSIIKQSKGAEGKLDEGNRIFGNLRQGLDVAKNKVQEVKRKAADAGVFKEKLLTQISALTWQQIQQMQIIENGSASEVVTEDKHTICYLCYNTINAPCHQSCSLLYMKDVGDFGFGSCACMNEGKCTVCPLGCGIETHVHVCWLIRWT